MKSSKFVRPSAMFDGILQETREDLKAV